MTASESEALLAKAEEALVAGRWAEARDGFRAALDIQESGTALFGLGLALWWLREPEASIRLHERAYRVFRRSGDNEHAFFAAMYLCLGYDMTFGNASASRGWLAKLSRLAREHGLVGLQAWELLCRAVADHDSDPVAAEQWARRALDIAAASGDVDLDVCARSELGAAMIELGRLSDGAELLDEAMAGALGGEVETLDSVVLASCRTIVSCSRAADVKRAAVRRPRS
jgi:tetratricopeptide (TPR) repeat protein